MKSVEAWMPLYVADYLKDTRHLSTEEHGAYLLLLMTAWTSDGALPADDDRLRRLTGMDAKAWKASRSVLLEFFTRDGDTWRHKRVDSEIIKARDISAERSEAGKRGAAARWGSPDGNCHSPANGKRMAKPLTSEKQTDAPSPSPSPLEEEPDGSPSKSAGARFALPDWVPEAEWLGFCEMRRRIKAPLTDRAKGGIIRELSKLAEDGHPPGRVLDQSTTNAWRGVFPLKDGTDERALARLQPAPAYRPDPVWDRFKQLRDEFDANPDAFRG